jgi:hypothetical protein
LPQERGANCGLRGVEREVEGREEVRGACEREDVERVESVEC